ncbi:hypothetical protein GY45DRAFT_639191 [Cubamyces sp. BRFM 1775]|nr:hypothetical protein GY45DRAFT_639191 [Cubamyces sp. BRFM 1775]
MAAAIALADEMEKIQRQIALHATKRVKAMDACFLIRAEKLVKHAEATGEWSDTPDDIRMRTTYDLSAFKGESADAAPHESRETPEPKQEDDPRPEGGSPHRPVVRTDEEANEVWRRQKEALDELKAKKKNAQTVKDEEFEMCKNILEARAKRRRERRPWLLRMESITN